jgi:NAD(P)H-dependent FMN reductase
MITIMAGTNREGSNTLKVAKEYQRFFEKEEVETTLFSLEKIDMLKRNADFISLEETYLKPAEKFVFVLPEYNGAFPGIFKLMIDMSEIASCWPDKKVMLVGLATGRAGNLRGLDIMTNICNYIKMEVLPNKIPLSSISSELENNQFIKEDTIEAIQNQIKQFISF